MITPLTPLDWYRRALKYYPDKTAVVDEEKRFTYREFEKRVNRLSNALCQAGIKNRDHVAVMLPNTHPMLESFYAITQLGAVIVPVNYRLTDQDVAYILNHSDSKFLIVDEEFADKVPREWPPALEKVIVVSNQENPSSFLSGVDYEEFLAGASDQPIQAEIDENQILSLNYTSGTTSRPKGVMLTHRNNYINAANFLYHLRVKNEDRYLHTLPMFHVNGWGGVWAITAAGGTHVCLRKVDPERILRLFDEEQITLLCGAPTVVNMMVHSEKVHGVSKSIPRRMATAGSPPPAAVIQKAQDLLGLEMIHVYGATEVSPFILYCEWKKEFDSLSTERQVTIKARQGVEMAFNGETKVVRQDHNGQEVEWNGQEIGEIVARGNVVMDGYYKQPEETKKAIRNGWYHTGDLAVVHPDGYIEILDRLKDIIISGGENISSTEVEGVLYKHPGIMEVAVIAVPHEKWGETPKAMVVRKDGADVTEAELIDYCRERMAHFKAPKSVEFVESLPKTATGKIQKFKLREQYWSGRIKVN
ncbi:fatty-acyl-CoA synthase [Melghirimyces profundicolus]|uniref:Fatty-acyl-CoA synthase n=1 Tax=Melghirimyces profundicolus TaxID=1242148 RepID=A0A2T6C0K7_9BACL|nr:long-chain-fatty-acid--CoA ligase [Melghirimyces profundicolus]PTX61863.1 fatty-acyl-CoA synthase [Melghirimyces profundicolus]